MKAAMKSTQFLTVAGLLALVLAAVVAAFMTRDAAVQETTKDSRTHLTPLVDERPMKTATATAKLAPTWDEMRFANQILRAADHEVDLAFEDALRDATNHPVQLTPQSRELYNRSNAAQARVKADQDRIDQLKKQLAAAPQSKQDTIQQQIDLVQAQLELDQDDLDDAREDLIRSGADKLSRVQRQFKRHEDAEHAADTTHAPNAPSGTAANYGASNLLGQVEAWRALRNKVQQLQAAHDEAGQIAATLSQNHDTLDRQLATDKAQQGQAAGGQPATGSSGASTQSAIASLKRLSNDQKSVSDLDKRIQDEQAQQTIYASWIALVQSHQRIAIHGMIQSALWILLIVLGVYLAGLLIDRYIVEVGRERTRLHTLRVVIRFAVQAVGLLLILAVILGTPQQMPTILGFAGAGLTVALKDFIVGFFGWFVLMGKNGLRVGDWVEINGVAGEVIEINLLRTVLLETGNWTTTGHPTGRKVAFVNSYAIEGHFFNFTTSGQWMWDEFTLTVPSDQDPYALIGTIEQAVAKETQESAEAAEKEWHNATSHYRVQSVSAAPAVNLRPTASGFEIHIRYVTRAQERSAMRSRVNQTMVQLLRHKGIPETENVHATK